jgi:glycosyltransferase involved in cell wall biosynthesis
MPVSVVVVTPFGAGGRGGMDRLTDLIVERTSGCFSSVDVSRLTARGGGGQFLGALKFASAASQLVYRCMLGRIHLLHLNVSVHGSFYRKYILSRIACGFGVPYAVHIHAGRFEQFWNDSSPRVAALIDTFLRSSARIIVLGNVYRELIAARAPHSVAKVAVLPNATEGRVARIPAEAPDAPVRITFLGRLGTLKGTPQLIEALGRLRARPGWIATLAGNGDVEESRRRIAELGLTDRVAIPGWLGPEGVDRLLERTDVLILPSFSEGLPMAIIEAFAAGIPVIATPVNAVVDVVQHERNGLLVKPGDIDAIAAALARLMDDPELRKRLGEMARQDHAERYDQRAYMERLIALWGETASRP